MIVITVNGRLAHQPEIKILPGGASCCEFRLLSTRFARGEEHVEAASFFCYGGRRNASAKTPRRGNSSQPLDPRKHSGTGARRRRSTL